MSPAHTLVHIGEVSLIYPLKHARDSVPKIFISPFSISEINVEFPQRDELKCDSMEAQFL